MFETEIEIVSEAPLSICGPWRRPANMLQAQTYNSHSSIHDDATAQRLGFRGGTIEGPTHFSQFAPLCFHIWGARWLEQGRLSANFRNAAYEGEDVRAHLTLKGVESASIEMVKRDGAPVLTGTASIGPAITDTAVSAKLSTARPLTAARILAGSRVGMRSTRRTVRLPFDAPMGELYPFSLRDKLNVMTEPSTWHEFSNESPWRRAVMPIEMISVLCQHLAYEDPFPIKHPVIGLFADLEIELVSGPLFSETDYDLERELVALTQTPKTECYWVRSRLFEVDSDRILAQTLLNQAMLKASSPLYET